MKTIYTQFLSFVLCLELVLAPFPKASQAEVYRANSAEITTPNHFLSTVAETSDRLYGPDGCANVNVNANKVKVEGTNKSTASAVHATTPEATSIDCNKLVGEHSANVKEAERIVSDANKQKPATATNASCVDCQKNGLNEALAKKEDKCSKVDKDRLALLQKDDPSCAPNNLVAGASNKKSCISEIKDTLWSTLKKQYKDAWAAGSSTFASHRKAEYESTDRALLYSGLPDKKVTEGGLNPVAFTKHVTEAVDGFFKSILAAIQGGSAGENAAKAANFGVTFLTGMDFGSYQALYQCAQCGDKTDVLCKLFGLMGKDGIDTMVMIIATGAIVGSAYGAVKAAAYFKKLMKPILAKESGLLAMEAESLAGHAVVDMGKETLPVSREAVAAFERQSETGPGAAAKAVAHSKPTFLPEVPLNPDTAMPREIIVDGGKRVEHEVREATAAQQVYDHTPGLKVPKDAGPVPIESVSSKPGSLIIESEMQPTPRMTKGISSLDKAGVATRGISDATPVHFATNEVGEVKALDETLNIHAPNDVHPSEAKAIHSYGEEPGKKPSFIVEKKDGRVAFVEYGADKEGNNGYFVKKEFSAKEAKAKNVDAFTDVAERNKGNEGILVSTEDNARANSVKITEVNSSEVGPKSAKVEVDGPGCPAHGSMTIKCLERPLK